MPDGAGVPSLARMARDEGGRFDGSSGFALRMLAQLASQYPRAAQSLLELMSSSRVPDSAWPGIAAALGGEQMSYGNSYLSQGGFATNAVDLKTYHIPSNMQSYQSVNVSGGWSPDRIRKQLGLIDRFRTASPAAAGMLEGTRNALAGRLAQ